MNQYKETIKKEKAALCKYRCHVICKNKCPWILLAISLMIPAIIVFIPSSESFCCKLIKFVENLSFGLLAGLVVYVFVTFLPSTKRQAKAIDAIYFQLYLISNQLDYMYYKFAPQKSKKDFRVFQTLLYNFIVKGAHIRDYNNENEREKNPNVNKEVYRYLTKSFSHINTNINILILSYRQDIRNEDIEVLLKIAQLKDDLAESLINDDVFNADFLEQFITEYSQLYCFQFPRVYKEYEKFKYWNPYITNP